MMMLPFPLHTHRRGLFRSFRIVWTMGENDDAERGGVREKRCLVTSAGKSSTYFCTKEEKWAESAFGVKQGRSHGEQRVTQNTDTLLSLPARLATVSRQTLFHLTPPPLYR